GRHQRRCCRARFGPRACRGARHLRPARIRSREASRLRGVGGADLARGARAGGEGRRHGRGTQAEATAVRAQYPFTVAWVREAIESLGDQYVVPPESELQSLVNWLNPLAFVYTWEGRPKAPTPPT